MTRLLTIAACVALILPATAPAQSAQGGRSAAEVTNASPPSAPVSRSAAGRDGDRRVCRNQGATGTRLGGTRVCKTAREWEEQRIAARDETERQQRSIRGATGF